MKPWVRWVAIVAGLAAVVVLFVVLNPGDDKEPPGPTATVTQSPTTTETETTPATQTESPTETSSASPTPDAVEIEVQVEDGEVQGPGDVEVRQGERVRLVVEADVSDEVHVHGYDLLADATPQEPAVIVFRATAPGVFEVELEGAALPLLELTVTP